MNREIKFRAWDKKHNCWDDDFAIHADGCLYQPAKARWDISDIAIETAYDELEVMQFTGLLDKYGVEIYESDIVRWNDDCDDIIERYYRRIDEVVEFKGGAFYPVCTMPESEFEVIGNIYENPELL